MASRGHIRHLQRGEDRRRRFGGHRPDGEIMVGRVRAVWTLRRDDGLGSHSSKLLSTSSVKQMNWTCYRRDLQPARRNAFDCALWDYRQTPGQRVWSLAGLDTPQPVTSAFTLSLDSPEKMAEAVALNASGHCSR